MKENSDKYIGRGIKDALFWAFLVGIAYFLADILDSITLE